MKEGEELCDNYGSSWGGGQGLGERRKALAANYGFTCTCIACAAEENQEAQRFQSLIQDGKETGGKVENDRNTRNMLDDLWKEHKRNQEIAWKGGNIRLDTTLPVRS